MVDICLRSLNFDFWCFWSFCDLWHHKTRLQKISSKQILTFAHNQRKYRGTCFASNLFNLCGAKNNKNKRNFIWYCLLQYLFFSAIPPVVIIWINKYNQQKKYSLTLHHYKHCQSRTKYVNLRNMYIIFFSQKRSSVWWSGLPVLLLPTVYVYRLIYIVHWYYCAYLCF